MQPTQVLHQRFQSLRDQGRSWHDIFQQVIGDVVVSIDLVFTKNEKAKRVFEEILSDFYTRPDYWSQLFASTHEEMEVLTRLGTVWSSRLNPIVASQFSDMGAEQVMLKYLGHLDPEAQREISVFDNLRGDAGYQAASLFYREYFVREADDYEVLLFWQLILNSVIRDLLDRTSRDLVERALKERGDYVRRNLRRLTLQIQQKDTLPLLQVSVQGQKLTVVKQEMPISDTVSAETLARKILIDASSNWLFSIPILMPGAEQPTDFLVVGPRYLAQTVRYSNHRLLSSGQSLVYARAWVTKLSEQKEFNTLISEAPDQEVYYSPVTVLLDEKPTREYIIRTLDQEEAFSYVAGFHKYVPEANPRGYVTAVGAFDDETLVGACVLNTAQARSKDGQFHIIEISRVVVQEEHRREGISAMLVQWVLDNKDLFNRSQFSHAQVITYSLVKEPGTLYQRVKTLYPVALLAPETRGRTNPVSDSFKIRWVSNPTIPVQAWLPKLHPLLMKVYLGINSYTFKPISRELSSSDFRGLRNFPQLSDVARLFWLDKVYWRSVEGKAYRSFVAPIALQQAITEYINKIWLPVIFPIYSQYLAGSPITNLDGINRASDLIVLSRLCLFFRREILTAGETTYSAVPLPEFKNRVLLLLNRR